MKYVEFYQIQNDGAQVTIATCELLNNKIVCRGDKNLIDNLSYGICDYSSSTNKKLTLADKEKFLEQLEFNFKSGYLNASEVMEKAGQ